MHGQVLLVLLGCALAAGCSPMVSATKSPYPIVTPEAPLLRDHNDIQVSGLYSNTGYSFGGAYAITDRVGIIARAVYGENGPQNHGGQQGLGEIGVGTFAHTKHNSIYELYGGAGWGASRYNWNESYDFGGVQGFASSNEERLNFWHTWLQFDAGWQGRTFSLAFLMRATYERVYRDDYRSNVYFEIDPGFFGDPTPPYSRSYSSNRQDLYFTPGIQGQIRLGHIYIEGSLCLLDASFKPVIGGIGLAYRF